MNEEQKQKLVTDRMGGAKMADLVAKYKISQTCAYSYVRAIANRPDDRARVTPEMRKQMVQLYQSGHSTVKIKKILGVEACTVRRALIALGVTLRSDSDCQRKYTINETVFDVINEESAYWAGFLLTDGCIFRHSVKLTLSSKDDGHLLKFLAFVGSNSPIRQEIKSGWSGGPISTVYFPSKAMCESLSRLGVVPRKTHIAKAPESLAFNRHFWRGAVDGDGGIAMTRGERRYPVLHFCSASLPFVEQFVSFCKYLVPSHRKSRKISRSHIWSVCVPGSIGVAVIRELYSGANVSLDRKQLRAEEAMNYKFYNHCLIKPLLPKKGHSYD